MLQCKAITQSGALLYCRSTEQSLPAIKGCQLVKSRNFSKGETANRGPLRRSKAFWTFS